MPRLGLRGGQANCTPTHCTTASRSLSGCRETVVWSEFRDVAHILAAGAYLAHCAVERGEKRAHSILSAILLVPEIVVALAIAFQKFGLTTIPHGRRTPIFDPETLWQLPETHVPEKLFLPVRVLTPRQIDLLQARRASKKYKPSPSRS